jgi:hypothetical protein
MPLRTMPVLRLIMYGIERSNEVESLGLSGLVEVT